jgi:dTMP kinase
MVRVRGLWICVVGIDGSGKTSLCNYLIDVFGTKAKFMKSPYFDWVREMIQISGDNSPYKDAQTDMLIFAANHRLEQYYIRKYLFENNFLVTQRFWLDFFVYQGVQGLSKDDMLFVLKPEKFKKPDIIFFLKSDPYVAFQRIKGLGGDKYEKLDLLIAHDKYYSKLFEEISNNLFQIPFSRTKIILIENNGSLDEMKTKVMIHLNNLKLI